MNDCSKKYKSKKNKIFLDCINIWQSIFMVCTIFQDFWAFEETDLIVFLFPFGNPSDLYSRI